MHVRLYVDWVVGVTVSVCVCVCVREENWSLTHIERAMTKQLCFLTADFTHSGKAKRSRCDATTTQIIINCSNELTLHICMGRASVRKR